MSAQPAIGGRLLPQALPPPQTPPINSGRAGTSARYPRSCRPPRMAQLVTWFVASLRDEDTHLGEEVTDGTVTAQCGCSFRPLTRLTTSPLDPLQVCPRCAQTQRGNSALSDGD